MTRFGVFPWNLKAYCILPKIPKMRIGCVSAQYMRKICARFSLNAQYMRKIVLISPMHNNAQDCTYFPNAQYMRKIVLLSPMRKIVLISPMRNICARLYCLAQDLRKIVLLSPMHNICTRFAQDCISLPNVQRLQALLEEICHISHICSKFRMEFTS